MPAHLDDDWLATFAAAAQGVADELVAAAGGRPLRVAMEVAGPEHDEVVRYHLCISPDGVDAGPGPATDADLTFRQGRPTAERIARGSLDARSAFLHGALTVEGDVRRLVDLRAVFEVLDAALAPLRADTTWGPGA